LITHKKKGPSLISAFGFLFHFLLVFLLLGFLFSPRPSFLASLAFGFLFCFYSIRRSSWFHCILVFPMMFLNFLLRSFFPSVLFLLVFDFQTVPFIECGFIFCTFYIFVLPLSFLVCLSLIVLHESLSNFRTLFLFMETVRHLVGSPLFLCLAQ
jgi:hypothetical protein